MLDYSLILVNYFIILAFLTSTECLATYAKLTIQTLENATGTIMRWMFAIKYFQAQKLIQKGGQNEPARGATKLQFWFPFICFILAILANYGFLFFLRKKCIPLTIVGAVQISPWVITFQANNLLVYALLKFLNNVRKTSRQMITNQSWKQMILHLLFASLGSILQLVSMIIFVTDQAQTNETLQVIAIWLTGFHYFSNCFLIYIVYKLSELKDSEQDDKNEVIETEEERDDAKNVEIQKPTSVQTKLI